MRSSLRPTHAKGDRALALASIVGPAAFIADWAFLGATRKGYSPVDEAISRLAELHAPTRPAMTAGFVVYSAGLAAYAIWSRRHLEGPGWIFAAATAATTVGVAAFPLGNATSGTIHAGFAAAGYLTLCAVPLASVPALRAAGRPRAARVSVASGIAGLALLAASVAGLPAHGLTQRAGLSVGDIWIIASVAMILKEPAALGR